MVASAASMSTSASAASVLEAAPAPPPSLRSSSSTELTPRSFEGGAPFSEALLGARAAAAAAPLAGTSASRTRPGRLLWTFPLFSECVAHMKRGGAGAGARAGGGGAGGGGAARLSGCELHGWGGGAEGRWGGAAVGRREEGIHADWGWAAGSCGAVAAALASRAAESGAGGPAGGAQWPLASGPFPEKVGGAGGAATGKASAFGLRGMRHLRVGESLGGAGIAASQLRFSDHLTAGSPTASSSITSSSSSSSSSTASSSSAHLLRVAFQLVAPNAAVRRRLTPSIVQSPPPGRHGSLLRTCAAKCSACLGTGSGSGPGLESG